MALGCSSQESASSKGIGERKTNVSADKTSDTHSQNNNNNEAKVQTYLENEFNGPSEELKNILDKEEFIDEVTAMNQYLEKHYKELIAEDFYETFVNTNEALRWLQPAYEAGYQLNAKKMDIQKAGDYNAYNFKVEVVFSKDGKSNTAAVTGYINFNKNGKISAIRDVNDGGLAKNFYLQKNE
ncbi:MAG: hypothetical protein ACO1OC_05285 [Tuberibacillus sp.]